MGPTLEALAIKSGEPFDYDDRREQILEETFKALVFQLADIAQKEDQVDGNLLASALGRVIYDVAWSEGFDTNARIEAASRR